MSDARTAFIATTVGTGLLAWSWWRSSGTASLDRQTTWTVIGVVALATVGTASLSWLVSGRRAVRLRRDELVQAIERTGELCGSGTEGSPVERTSFVAVAGSRRYHLDGCLLVRGKQVHDVPTRARTLSTMQPCEMCEP